MAMNVFEYQWIYGKILTLIMSELTVLKDGKIVNTTLVIPAKFSAEFSDQKLLDIKGIITHTQLDEIPHNTSAVRFNWGIPRELIVQLLESKNWIIQQIHGAGEIRGLSVRDIRKEMSAGKMYRY